MIAMERVGAVDWFAGRSSTAGRRGMEEGEDDVAVGLY